MKGVSTWRSLINLKYTEQPWSLVKIGYTFYKFYRETLNTHVLKSTIFSYKMYYVISFFFFYWKSLQIHLFPQVWISIRNRLQKVGECKTSKVRDKNSSILTEKNRDQRPGDFKAGKNNCQMIQDKTKTWMEKLL